MSHSKTSYYRFSTVILISQYLLWTILLCSPIISVGQINLDSTYRISEIEEMLKTARETKNKNDLAAGYFLLAEFEANSFDNAGEPLRNYAISKEYYSLLKDTLMESKIDMAMGLKYLKAGYNEEALQGFNRALKYFEKVDDLRNVTYLNFYIAQVYREKIDPEEEIHFLNKAVSLNRSLKDSLLLVDILIHKIGSYETLNVLDTAEILAIDVVKLSGKLVHRESMSRSLYHLGRINKLRGNIARALKYLKEAFEFVDNSPFNEHRRLLYKETSIVYENLGDYENALKYTRRYTELNDSILNKNRIESQNKFAIYYQADEKEEDNVKLQKDNESIEEKNVRQRNAMYILTAGMILLLALLYYIINFYRQKIRTEDIIHNQQREIKERKIRELEDNMKISSMQSMLEGQELERERISKDLHDSLGGLLSTIKLQFDSVQAKKEEIGQLKEYKSANKMLDTAVQEVRSISQNLQPGSLMELGLIAALNDLFNRFDEDIYPEIDFQYYSIPTDIPNMVSLSIYRVIQELLHNAIKHAKANEILIQINSEGDELVIQFEDDGVGYDPENLKRKGMGLENMKSRIAYLKGQISTDSQEGEGTSTMIRLNYKSDESQ